MKLAILGGGELGKLIAEHSKSINRYNTIGFYDDHLEKSYSKLYPILGKINDVETDFRNGVFDFLIVGVGYNHFDVRASLFEKFKNTIPFASIIHPSAYVDSSCTVGDGVFILPGVVLDLEVVVENNVLINTGTIVAHHSKIGRNSFIAPGVKIAGLVNIGASCFIGIGATIKDGIKIGDRGTIGAGSLVLKDTLENSLYYGAPAIKIK